MGTGNQHWLLLYIQIFLADSCRSSTLLFTEFRVKYYAATNFAVANFPEKGTSSILAILNDSIGPEHCHPKSGYVITQSEDMLHHQHQLKTRNRDLDSRESRCNWNFTVELSPKLDKLDDEESQILHHPHDLMISKTKQFLTQHSSLYLGSIPLLVKVK